MKKASRFCIDYSLFDLMIVHMQDAKSPKLEIHQYKNV